MFLPRGTAAAAPVAPRAARPLPVLTELVEPATGYDVRRVHSGELRPHRAAVLGFEVNGRIEEVLVEEGDPVDAGQELARLESDRVRADIAALEAALSAERALLAELEKGPRAQTIDAARAEVAVLDEQIELARLQRERREALVGRDATSIEQLDVAAANEATLEARRLSAKARLDELEEGTRAEALERQRAAVARLDAQLERANVELADRVLRAPFAGTIVERALDEGAVVEPGQMALRIIEHAALEARVGIPVARAAELAPGDDVTLELRGASVVGTVRSVVPEIDAPTRTADVVVELSPEDSLHHVSGEVARLVLFEHVDAEGFWLPTDALVPGTRGLWAAFVATPGESENRLSVERLELEVVHTAGDRALVRGTLREGYRVIVDGVHRVVPGQLVVDAEGERRPLPRD